MFKRLTVDKIMNNQGQEVEVGKIKDTLALMSNSAVDMPFNFVKNGDFEVDDLTAISSFGDQVTGYIASDKSLTISMPCNWAQQPKHTCIRLLSLPLPVTGKYTAILLTDGFIQGGKQVSTLLLNFKGNSYPAGQYFEFDGVAKEIVALEVIINPNTWTGGSLSGINCTAKIKYFGISVGGKKKLYLQNSKNVLDNLTNKAGWVKKYFNFTAKEIKEQQSPQVSFDLPINSRMAGKIYIIGVAEPVDSGGASKEFHFLAYRENSGNAIFDFSAIEDSLSGDLRKPLEFKITINDGLVQLTILPTEVAMNIKMVIDGFFTTTN